MLGHTREGRRPSPGHLLYMTVFYGMHMHNNAIPGPSLLGETVCTCMSSRECTCMTKSGQICATLFTHYQSCFRCITSKIIRHAYAYSIQIIRHACAYQSIFHSPSPDIIPMHVHVCARGAVRVKYPLSMHVHTNSSTKCTLGYACA